MKFLSNQTSEFLPAVSRLVYLDVLKESILPKNPLAFGYSDLVTIKNKAEGKDLGKEDRLLLGQTVNFQLEKAFNGSKKNQTARNSERLLIGIFRDPFFNRHLTPEQRQKIESLISEERKTIEALAEEKPENWSSQQVIRVLRSYRNFRSSLNLKNLKIDEKIADIGDKIKIYAVELLNRSGELAFSEQAFLLEVKRVFPTQNDWASQAIFETLETKTGGILTSILRQVESNDNIALEIQPYWDLLVENIKTQDVPETLKNFLARQTEVSSLVYLVNRFEDYEGQTLTPEELNFLIQLKAQASEDYQIGFDEEKKVEVLKTKAEEKEQALENMTKERQEKFDEFLKLSGDDLLDKLGSEHPEYKEFEKQKALLSSSPIEKAEKGKQKQIKTKLVDLVLDKEDSGVPSQTQIETAISEEKAAKNEWQTTANDWQSTSELYADVPGKAAELLESFTEKLNARFANKNLAPQDYLLMSSDEVSLDDFLTDDGLRARWQLAQRVRDQVATIISESDSFTAKDRLLTPAAIRAKLAASDKEENKNILQEIEGLSEYDQRAMLEAVCIYHREKVLAAMNQIGQVGFEEFLSNYQRQRGDLTNSGYLDALNQAAQTIENKKIDLDKTKAHAQETISSLFSEGDSESIVNDLGKILRPTHKTQAVYDKIYEKLNEIPVGGCGDTEIGVIKDFLRDKIYPELADEVSLQRTVEGLVYRIDQQKIRDKASQGLDRTCDDLNHHKTTHTWMNPEQVRLLSQRTLPLKFQTQKVTDELEKKVASLQEKAPKLAPGALQYEVDQLMKFYKGNFTGVMSQLLRDFKTEFSTIFPDQKDQPQMLAHFSEIEANLERIKAHFDVIEANRNNLTLHYGEFESLGKHLSKLAFGFDFQANNAVEADKKSVEVTVANSAEIHAYIKDELEILGVGGQERARKKFEEKRVAYRRKVQGFESHFLPAQKRIKKDLLRLDDEAFQKRHGRSKVDARKNLSNTEHRLEDAQTIQAVFDGRSGTSFYTVGEGFTFDAWFADYQDPENQAKALNFMSFFKEFEEILDEEGVNDKTNKDFKSWVEGYDKNSPFIKWPNVEIKWYSLKSIWMMAKYAFQSVGKNQERINDKAMADLGEQVFGDSRIGREFKKEANDKEKERIDYWKASYADFDTPKLQHVIEGVTSVDRKDEARGAIEMLIEKGEITVDSPLFLDCLERLSGVKFTQADRDEYVQNQDALNRKVGEVYAGIWDTPAWIKTKEDFESKYKAAMKKHEGNIKNEVFTGAIDAYFLRSLRDWENGTPSEDFERTKFEQYLQGAVDQGLMNGYPSNGDRRLFYLIKAFNTLNPKTGERLLTMDSFRRFADLVNKIPYLDGLDDSSTWKKDGRVVPPGTPGAEVRHWSREDLEAWGNYFKGIDLKSLSYPGVKTNEALSAAGRKWFNECLAPTDDAQDRTAKVQPENVDHDDAGNLPLQISPEKLKDVLNYNSGDVRQVTEKFQVNIMNSFEENFKNMKDYLHSLKEYKDADGYQDHMEKELRRFGQMLRTYFVASHQMAGNWDAEGSVGSVVLSDTEWGRVDDSYKKISEVIYDLTNSEKIKDMGNVRRKIQKSSEGGQYEKVKDQQHKEEMLEIKRIYEAKKPEDNYFADTKRLAKLAGIDF